MTTQPAQEEQFASLQGVDAQHLVRLVHKHPDGIVVIDGSGNIRFANPAAERLFAREDLVGSAFGAPLKAAERTVLEIPRPGELTRVELEVVDIEWEGQDAHLVSLRDVEERERLEEQLRQAQKMEAVGHLAAGVAHDFNNVLTGIMGAAAFLKAALEERGEDTADVEMIQSLSDRAAAMVQQLLDFSREQVVAQTPQPLATVIDDAMGLITPLIGEAMEIETRVESADALVLIDRRRFQQVLLNLALNARDALGGRGRLTIATELRFVDAAGIGAATGIIPGTYAVVSVADKGSGIAPEAIGKVFDPFFTTKSRAEGTGLGLSVAFGIVAAHGGTITVDSSPGEGTVFDIYLPLAQGELCMLGGDSDPS